MFVNVYWGFVWDGGVVNIICFYMEFDYYLSFCCIYYPLLYFSLFCLYYSFFDKVGSYFASTSFLSGSARVINEHRTVIAGIVAKMLSISSLCY